MAEAFALIGLASSILTFVDFGSKLISFVKSIRDSPDGRFLLFKEFDDNRRRLLSLSQALRGSKIPELLSQDENKIILLAEDCAKLASDLDDILERLGVREAPRRGTLGTVLNSIKVGVKAMYSQSDILSLESRLEHLSSSLQRAVNRALQQHRHSEILFQLGALYHNLDITNNRPLDHIQRQILDLTAEDSAGPMTADHIRELVGRLEKFEEEYWSWFHASRVLQRLNFEEIKRRWDRIEDTTENTNMWIFDRSTDFLPWLESERRIFWISGKAGSGKSTLMKFLSNHPNTRQSLERWAHPKKLHIVDFYFWNQGFELQKSQRGLLRTVLFRILRDMPQAISTVCPNLPEADWTIEELKHMLHKTVHLDDVPSKFCFFIDGLDEYQGGEEDLIDILSLFSETSDLKLCVSSRPRLVLDNQFEARRTELVISDFTFNDMRIFVEGKLKTTLKSLELRSSGEDYQDIITQIAEDSKGVWLWVRLVTHNLVRAVNRDEGIDTIRKILNQFPKELEEYFRYIIENIEPEYRDEMAQIFLIAVDEVQPLPLFALTLLQREKSNSMYAVMAPLQLLDPHDMLAKEKNMKSRLQNRCKDLLIVESGQHPVFLRNPVDFLHRTVRDFLRDCYYDQLRSEVAADFDPLVSLSNMMLFLVKSLGPIDIKDPPSINRLFQIVDELLYYAYEAEKGQHDAFVNNHLIEVLDNLEITNNSRNFSSGNHWTNLRDSPIARGDDEYREGGNCNFLALAVQARLTKYVRVKLDMDPMKLHKPRRPLLDYALRPRRVTSLTMPFHSQRAETPIDIKMVRLLLEKGADPNQAVHLNDGRTVWALFLVSCYESIIRENVAPTVRDCWYVVSEVLIEHGAKSNCWLGTGENEMTMDEILEGIFEGKAEQLKISLAEQEARRRYSVWPFKSLSGWNPLPRTWWT